MEVEVAKGRAIAALEAVILSLAGQCNEIIALGDAVSRISIGQPVREDSMAIAQDLLSANDFYVLRLVDLVLSHDQNAEYELSVFCD